MLADALLRSVAGTTAQLRVTGTNADAGMFELGLVATTFSDVVVGPVVMRRLQPAWQKDGKAEWELLMSATGVEQQVAALDLPSVRSLFDMTIMVTVGGQDFLIESVASNEAFGQVYLYRLLLRETNQQAV
jgi:hypothetical protein